MKTKYIVGIAFAIAAVISGIVISQISNKSVSTSGVENPPNDSIEPDASLEINESNVPTVIDKCPFGIAHRTESRTVYANQKLGFQINMPVDWYLPSTENETDPHFYQCTSVGKVQDGFEISFADRDTSLDANFRKLAPIISNAEIYEQIDEGGLPEWGHVYYVHFRSGESFWIMIENDIKSYDFFSSFKLI